MNNRARITRYRWRTQRPAQIRQFLYRLFPLLLIIIASILLVWIFNYSAIRETLDESAFELATTKTIESVDDYFNPLIDLISSSVLWGSIGEIDSIGEPDEYIGLLQKRLELSGSVASLSLTDAQGMELVTSYPHGTEDWYVTGSDQEDSLSYQRTAKGIDYLSYENQSSDSMTSLISGSGLRVSEAYSLPAIDMQGITLTLLPSSQYGNREVSLSVDLSFSMMAERLKDGGAVDGTLIFLLMPNQEDYLLLPLDDLIHITDTSDTILELGTPLDDSAQELISFLDEHRSESSNEDLRLRFESGDKTWLTEFHQMQIGNDSLTIGTLVPTDSLWTFRYALPLQIFLVLIFGAAGFLGYRLIQDFQEISRSPELIEQMLREEIDQGESAKLEFKSSLRWDYREDKFNKGLEDIIVKSVAAFNNAQGGTLLIGVADEGEILGLEKDYSVLKQPGKDYYEIHLRNLLGSKYGTGYTSKSITIDFPELSAKEICRIRIRKGSKPLFTTVKSKSGGPVEKFYIRSGNTSQVLTNPSEITNYILTRFSRWGMGKTISEA